MLVFLCIVVFAMVSLVSYYILLRLHARWMVRQRLASLSRPSPKDKASAKQVLAVLSRLLGVKSSRKLALALERAGWSIRASEFVVLNAAAAGAPLLFALRGPLILALGLALVGAAAPQLYLRMCQLRRVHRVTIQIPEMLVMVSNALKAGYSFLQAMELVAEEMPPPLADEFARALREMNLGVTTEQVLVAMVDRVSSDDLDLVVTAVLIQRQIGGNLAEVLDSIANTIRERIRIQGELKTLTAQGRLSGVVISALPMGLGALIFAMNPAYMSVLFVEPVGRVLLVMGAMGQLLAALCIRRIVAIEV